MQPYEIPTVELKRRSVPAGLAVYMMEEPAVREDVRKVADDLRLELSPTMIALLDRHDSLFEPRHPDIAAHLSQRYAGSPHGRPLMAIMLRSGGVGHLTAISPQHREMNAEHAMMNVGDHSPLPGEGVDEVNHRSEASKEKCRIGCASIVRRRAGRCLHCGTPRESRLGVRALRHSANHYCNRACEDGGGLNRRYREDAVRFIFDQMSFLLEQVGGNTLLCEHRAA